MSNPIPRWQFVASNFAATALSLREAAKAALNLWPLCIFFGGLAMLCSAAFRRRMLAIAIPGVVLIGMYFMHALGNLIEEI